MSDVELTFFLGFQVKQFKEAIFICQANSMQDTPSSKKEEVILDKVIVKV
jgi:hypothetical protein